MEIKRFRKTFLLLAASLAAFSAVCADRGPAGEQVFGGRVGEGASKGVGFVPLRIMNGDDVPFGSAGGIGAGVVLAPRGEVTDLPVLYGTVITSKKGADGSAANKNGMYAIDASANTFRALNTTGNAKFGGAPMANGYYYAVNTTGTGKIYLDRFDTSTWKRATHTLVTGNGILASDVAWDPTSDMVYGCFYNDEANGYVFGKIDYTNRRRIQIKPLEMNYNSVMVDPQGQVYAIDMTGNLLKVDKTTGEATQVGYTGVTPLYVSSATIDLSTGRCFWTVNPIDGKGYLYEVNLASGQASLICEFAHSDEVTGLYIPLAAAEGGVPAAVSSLSAAFVDGSLQGNVSFTTPSNAVDATALSGELTWRLWVDGVLKAEGKAQPGTKVEVPVSVAASGRTSFAAAVSNGEGESARSYTKVFVGNDTPLAPVPSLTYADGAFEVSWAKVTGTVNNGYIDPERVTYTVTRLPDNVVVAENISATSIRDTVAPTPGRVIAYKYSVRATFEESTGAAGVSPVYPLGVISTPYFEGFDNSEAMNNFIILDCNGDGKKWEYSGGMSSAYITSSTQKHDDWLITAAIQMKPGVKYKLGFEAMASFNAEKIEVKMGRSATAESMTVTLVAETELDPNFQMKPSVPEFTVEEEGLYYIGWHAVSDANSFYLYVDNISLTDDAEHEEDAIEPPYMQPFDESASLSEFTVIDGNKDGYMWNISDGEARVAGAGNGLDDWMISRPFNLKAGNRYAISLKAHGYNDMSETVEVKLGGSATVEGMTTSVISPSTVGGDVQTLTGWFEPEADGKYYIGIHGCSVTGMMLYVDDFKVASPVTASSPASVSSLTLEPSPYGELSGTVRFTAPTVTVGGSALTSLTRIEVLEGDEVKHTFTAPSPGSALEALIPVSASGIHHFTVISYNETGAGIPAEVSGYLGVNKPGVPRNVVITEEGNTGKVTVSWEAPATDIAGVPVKGSDMKYIVAEVINGQTLIVARDLSALSYSLQAVSPDAPQQFKTYAVFAETSAGMGSGMTSTAIPVGKPVEMPFEESFANGTTSMPMVGAQLVPEVNWSLYNDNTTEVNSQDGDNGFIALSGKNSGATGALLTGKIYLDAEKKPELTFYVYNLSDNQYADNNEIIIQLETVEDQPQQVQLDQFAINGRYGTERGWHKVALDLREYKGKTVRLAIGARTIGFSNVLLDNFAVKHNPTLWAEETLADNLIVYGGTGYIRITGAENSNVSVTDMSGRVVYHSGGISDVTVSAQAGVYVVRVDERVFKLMVR